jgi:hypothetical protein
MGAFSNIKGLTYYGDNADDPYILPLEFFVFLLLHSPEREQIDQRQVGLEREKA